MRAMLCGLALSAWSMTALAAPSNIDASAIVGKIERNLAPTNVKGTYVFTNHRTDGTVMTYEVRLELLDVNHNHIYFEKPEREKGREVLRVDDAIWTYVPSVGRVVRIADRDSFAGGDFSNADVLRVDWSNQFTVALLKDLPNQWIFEMKARVPDAAYAKMRLWVDKKNGQPVQQLYYDSQGTLLKKCLYGSVTAFVGIERPAKLRMENVITKQASELEVRELSRVKDLPVNHFVVDNLGK